MNNLGSFAQMAAIKQQYKRILYPGTSPVPSPIGCFVPPEVGKRIIHIENNCFRIGPDRVNEVHDWLWDNDVIYRYEYEGHLEGCINIKCDEKAILFKLRFV